MTPIVLVKIDGTRHKSCKQDYYGGLSTAIIEKG